MKTFCNLIGFVSLKSAICIIFVSKNPFTPYKVAPCGRLVRVHIPFWLRALYSVCIALNQWGSIKACLIVVGSMEVDIVKSLGLEILSFDLVIMKWTLWTRQVGTSFWDADVGELSFKAIDVEISLRGVEASISYGMWCIWCRLR